MIGLSQFINESLVSNDVKYYKSSTTLIPETSDLEFFKSQFNQNGHFNIRDYEKIVSVFKDCLTGLSVFKNSLSDLMDYIYIDFRNLIFKGEYIFQTLNFCSDSSIVYPSYTRQLKKDIVLTDSDILLLNRSLCEMESFIGKLKPHEYNITKSKILNSWYNELISFVNTVRKISKEIIINQEK